MEKKKRLKIYTDGSCINNPGPGGWAYILLYKDRQKEESGSECSTTNNRMELTAVIKSLESIKSPCPIALHLDSEYIYNAIKKGWLENWEKNGFIASTNKPVKNRDLWERLSLLVKKYDIEWIKVKAHSDDSLNILADKLANDAARKQVNGAAPSYYKEYSVAGGSYAVRSYICKDRERIKKINDITLNKKGKLEKQGLKDSDFEMLLKEHNTVRVLEYNKNIIGFYWLYYNPDYFQKNFNNHYNLDNLIYLLAIAIHPDYQGKGLGRLLLRNIYEFARENSMNRILLDVALSNKEAYEWYLREGFIEAEKQIYMIKEISDG